MARHITAWVDLCAISPELSSNGLKLKYRPSLRDSMLSPGFSQDSVHKRRSIHAAGMDAVRTVATLVKILSLPAGKKTDIVPFTKEERSRRKLWEKRPGAGTRDSYRSFPFTAKIATAGKLMPPSLQHSDQLWRHVTRYSGGGDPLPWPLSPPSYKGRPKTHGWIRFRSQEALLAFVRHFN